MGELAAGFDADLRALLTPWAGDAGLVYEVETRLVWGAPRTAPANR